MARHLWVAALACLATVGVSSLSAAEPQDFLSGVYYPERQPTLVRPVVDVGGIVDSAIRGDVPGIVASAVPNRYSAYVWGYYPWQNYVPRPYYGYGYPRYGYAYPYRGYVAPGYGANGNDVYDYRYSNPGYSVSRPYSYEEGTNGAGRSIVAPPSNPATASEPARVVNPADNAVTLSFVVDSQVYTVAPGSYQDVLGGPDRVISFDRGDSRGTGRYSLRAGTYTFAATKSGWELYHTQPPSRQGEVIPAPEPTPAPR